jgi:hypothetical protein
MSADDVAGSSASFVQRLGRNRLGVLAIGRVALPLE